MQSIGWRDGRNVNNWINARMYRIIATNVLFVAHKQKFLSTF